MLLLSSLFFFFFFYLCNYLCFVGVEAAETVIAPLELQDESGDGVERPGPRTNTEIVKNSTVLTEDSVASERPPPPRRIRLRVPLVR